MYVILIRVIKYIPYNTSISMHLLTRNATCSCNVRPTFIEHIHIYCDVICAAGPIFEFFVKQHLSVFPYYYPFIQMNGRAIKRRLIRCTCV